MCYNYNCDIIKHYGFVKPHNLAFDLESRVPQRSVLGSTFYSLYTNVTPEPNNLTLKFAGDVTQIITTDKGEKNRTVQPNIYP